MWRVLGGRWGRSVVLGLVIAAEKLAASGDLLNVLDHGLDDVLAFDAVAVCDGLDGWVDVGSVVDSAGWHGHGDGGVTDGCSWNFTLCQNLQNHDTLRKGSYISLYFPFWPVTHVDHVDQ